MEIKKKILGLVFSMMLGVGSLTACGTGSSEDSISVVTREEGSGTRGAFVELTGVEEKDADGNRVDNTTPDAISVNSTAIVMTTVAGYDKAIGYISLGALNNTIKAVQIDGIEPTAKNIGNGSYTLSRPLYIVAKENLSEPAQDFRNFIFSVEGQKIITEQKYIEVENTGSFASNGARGKVIISGSSSVTPVMQKLQEAYQDFNPRVKIEVQESDSTTGINSTANGICDIGMASRNLKAEEIKQGLKATAIALDGIVVVVHKDNNIHNLTMKQVREIFNGTVTRWGDIEQP